MVFLTLYIFCTRNSREWTQNKAHCEILFSFWFCKVYVSWQHPQKYLLIIPSSITFLLRFYYLWRHLNPFFVPGEFRASKFHAPDKFNFEGISTCWGFRRTKDFSGTILKSHVLKGSALGLFIGLEFKDCLHGDGLEGGWQSKARDQSNLYTTYVMHVYIYMRTSTYRFTNVVLPGRQKTRCTYICFLTVLSKTLPFQLDQ